MAPEGVLRMTRDETVALFLECDAKRAEARAAALAQGKSERDADAAAHEAAKAHWNAWAEPLLAEHKAMEADGRWVAEKDWTGDLEPKNAETRDWMKKAEAIFFRCLFLVRGAEGTKATAGERENKESEDGEPPVKLIQLEGDSADFSGFIFPGTAWFDSAAFTGGARFDSATFTGTAQFYSATFTGNARFDSATFTGTAQFYSATFTGNARFDSTTFGHAWFDSATFTGYAEVYSATFTRGARFGSATFSGTAQFVSATFGYAEAFYSATFTGHASFGSATFTGDARSVAPPSRATPRLSAPPSRARPPGSIAPPSRATPRSIAPTSRATPGSIAPPSNGMPFFEEYNLAPPQASPFAISASTQPSKLRGLAPMPASKRSRETGASTWPMRSSTLYPISSRRISRSAAPRQFGSGRQASRA